MWGVNRGRRKIGDKSTRQSLKKSIQDAKEGKRSSEPSVISKVKDEVLYWKDAIEEIRRNNPELERSLKDAKDTFVERKNKSLN